MSVALLSLVTWTGVALSSPVPSPSRPQKLLPQQSTVPSSISAQAYLSPARIVATSLSPSGETGVALLVVVPSPSWPVRFLPQHLASPSPSTAQSWASPALIAVAPAESARA